MLCPPSMKFHVTASPAFTATFFGLKLSFWTDTLDGAATAGVAKAQAAMPALAKDIDAGSRTALSSQEVVTAGTKDRAETLPGLAGPVAPVTRCISPDAIGRIEHSSRGRAGAAARPPRRAGDQVAAGSRKPVTARRRPSSASVAKSTPAASAPPPSGP